MEVLCFSPSLLLLPGAALLAHNKFSLTLLCKAAEPPRAKVLPDSSATDEVRLLLPKKLRMGQKLRGSFTRGCFCKWGASSYWCPWGRDLGSGSGGWSGVGFPV